MQILPTLSCCHLPTTPIQKRKVTTPQSLDMRTSTHTHTHSYCGFSCTGGDGFSCTVAQAATLVSLPCGLAHQPPFANTASRIVLLAKGTTGKHMAHPAGCTPPSIRLAAALHQVRRVVCTLSAPAQPALSGQLAWPGLDLACPDAVIICVCC